MVSIITCTIREEMIETVFRNFEQQNYQEKELIIILNKNSMNIDSWKKRAEQSTNVRVYQIHEDTTLGDCLNFGVTLSKYDCIAKFDDDDYYGPKYISSMMEDFETHEADIIGKSSFYLYFKNKRALVFIKYVENIITDYLAGASMLFKKEIFKKVRFEKTNTAEDYFFVNACLEHGFKIYSSHRHHYCGIRHDLENHTWKITDEELMNKGKIVAYTDDFESIVNDEGFQI